MASASKCPPHISLHEYKAFGITPLRHNIRYLNILAQIAMPTVDFTKTETQSLILQAIHLAGPRSEKGDVERQAHQILLNKSFCKILITNFMSALPAVSKN
jgi:hypothetical protein